MGQQTIAVDVDDVLFDEHHNIRTFINENYKLDLTPAHYDIDGAYWGYWEKVWGVGKEKGAERYRAYIESEAKSQPHVMPDAIDVINELKKRFRLVIITSRENIAIDLTHKWLEEHFPKTFNSVEFVGVWSADRKASKAEIAQRLGASYIIDDSPDHCQLAAESGIRSLLFGDYGYNRLYNVDAKMITRVRNWQEVKEFFDATRDQ